MPGRNPDNRSTPSNAWKPPPDEGTTSPQRALRWQASTPPGKEAKEDETEEDDKTSRSPEDSRSSKSGSTTRTSGTRSSKSSKKNKKEKKDGKVEDEGTKEPGLVEWFGDPLKPGIEASLGDGGKLYSTIKKGIPRAGMCNPPMNEKVRAMLVADLNQWKVEPIVTSKKEKREQEEAEEKNKKKESRRKIEVPASRNFGDDEGAAEMERNPGEVGWASATTLPAGFTGGSVGSSRMSSPALLLRDSSRRTTRDLRGLSPTRWKKKKGHESAWQLDDITQEKAKKYGLDSAPEGEVKWRSNMLRRRCRDHGFLIEKTDVSELGHLSMYHNWFSRGPLQHPPPALHPVIPSKQVRDIGCDLDKTTHCLHNISDDVAKDLIPRTRRFRLGPTQEAPSMERLMEMSGHMMHAGPNTLQLMCANAGISVHHGGKLPKGGMEPQDDPLFSNRPGGTPRTSTGKPLPVPHWGRNGNAPSLREPKVESR